MKVKMLKYSKYYKIAIKYLLSAFFCLLLFLLYFKQAPINEAVWLLFWPIKTIALFSKKFLFSSEDQVILFSLFIGTPLNFFYWKFLTFFFKE